MSAMIEYGSLFEGMQKLVVGDECLIGDRWWPVLKTSMCGSARKIHFLFTEGELASYWYIVGFPGRYSKNSAHPYDIRKIRTKGVIIPRKPKPKIEAFRVVWQSAHCMEDSVQFTRARVREYCRYLQAREFRLIAIVPVSQDTFVQGEGLELLQD